MHQRQEVYQVFTLFALLSFIILIISPYQPFLSVRGGVERLFSPLQRSIYINFGLSLSKEAEEIKLLKEKNLELQIQLVKLKTLQDDNQALRDQFIQQRVVPAQGLAPAQIIGSNALLPGVLPEQITINIGEKQGIKQGMAVIYKDILIGYIATVSEQRAMVKLITNEKTALTAKTIKTDALGIIKGEGNDMLFDQVLLSEKLEQDDLVITRGEINEKGAGYPPNLLIGKISAINKKPSALFQSARIDPLIDITKLSMVFVVIER
jgi:rod shape-determining protein MreC